MKYIFVIAYTLFNLVLPHNSYAFSDITDYQEHILYLKEKNIINGHPDGTFRPKSLINRAEFIKILLEARFPNTKISCNWEIFGEFIYFKDTTYKKNSWYEPYVCYGSYLNIINGYKDGTFLPEQPITYAEAAKMLIETFRIPIRFSYSNGPHPMITNLPVSLGEVSGKDWYTPYIKTLENRNISLWFTPEEKLTRFINREETAIMISSYINYLEERTPEELPNMANSHINYLEEPLSEEKKTLNLSFSTKLPYRHTQFGKTLLCSKASLHEENQNCLIIANKDSHPTHKEYCENQYNCLYKPKKLAKEQSDAYELVAQYISSDTLRFPQNLSPNIAFRSNLFGGYLDQPVYRVKHVTIPNIENIKITINSQGQDWSPASVIQIIGQDPQNKNIFKIEKQHNETINKAIKKLTARCGTNEMNLNNVNYKHNPEFFECVENGYSDPDLQKLFEQGAQEEVEKIFNLNQ